MAVAVLLAGCAWIGQDRPPTAGPTGDCPGSNPSQALTSGLAPDFQTAPTPGLAIDLTQGLTLADPTAFWSYDGYPQLPLTDGVVVAFVEQVDAGGPTDPVTYVGAWLRGVDLASGTVAWTLDLTDQVRGSATGLSLSGTSNGVDAFAVALEPDLLPEPDSPGRPTRLLTLDARTGHVLAARTDPGSPGLDSTAFLIYAGRTVVYRSAGVVYGAADTDLTTPVWSRPAGHFGDTVIAGQVQTADGYADPVSGAVTGPPAVPTMTLATWYVSQADHIFRLQNPKPADNTIGMWQPGPLLLVDATGQPLWPAPAIIYDQQLAVTDDLVIATCSQTEICGFGLDDGLERWHQTVDQPATVLGAGGDWVFVQLRHDYPEPDSVVALRASDGTTGLTVPVSSGIDPIWLGQCLVYYQADNDPTTTGDNQFVARDLRSPTLAAVWTVPAFDDGIVTAFDGVMVLENRLGTPTMTALRGS